MPCGPLPVPTIAERTGADEKSVLAVLSLLCSEAATSAPHGIAHASRSQVRDTSTAAYRQPGRPAFYAPALVTHSPLSFRCSVSCPGLRAASGPCSVLASIRMRDAFPTACRSSCARCSPPPAPRISSTRSPRHAPAVVVRTLSIATLSRRGVTTIGRILEKKTR